MILFFFFFLQFLYQLLPTTQAHISPVHKNIPQNIGMGNFWPRGCQTFTVHDNLKQYEVTIGDFRFQIYLISKT